MWFRMPSFKLCHLVTIIFFGCVSIISYMTLPGILLLDKTNNNNNKGHEERVPTNGERISHNEENIFHDEELISTNEERISTKGGMFSLTDKHNDSYRYQENKEAHKNVVFLKLHKVASSTLQNIFFRFADNNDLNICLPSTISNGYNNFGYPNVFSKRYVWKSTQPFNVIAHHMRYSEAVRNVMPADSKYVTIIRHPDTQFISAFNYFNFGQCYGVPTIDDFAQNVVKEGKFAKLCQTFTRNAMLYDFGLAQNAITNNTLINEKIKNISLNFDLVLLTEYFDEGLILLRDLLNWRAEDILYLSKIKNRLPKQQIKSETINLLRAWNAGDIRLYDYFNKTFWEKVDKYGRNKLNLEVENLRSANKKWYDFCIKDMVPGTEVVDPDFKADYKDDTVMGYNLNDDVSEIRLCRQLATQEWAYTRKIIRKMKELQYVV